MKENTNAHGLQGLLEQPDWPRLNLPEVNRVLRRYPQADGAVKLLSFSPRPFSAASMVSAPRGEFFVKRHHRSVRDREGLLEEHRFVDFLATTTKSSAGLVQAPLLNEDGSSVTTDGDWTYELYRPAKGVDVYEQALSWTPFLSIGHARAAGRALARMHLNANGYSAPARGDRQLVSSFTIFAGNWPAGHKLEANSVSAPAARMEDYLEKRPLLLGYAERLDWRRSFDRLLLPLFEKLEPWLSYLEPLWTHNDFHASNLMWSGETEEAEVLGVIDFGLADRTNAVYDLTTAIERNIVEWLRMNDPGAELSHLDHLDALLAGYQESRKLHYAEARALVAMLPLVHCEFALSETDYFLSILRSEQKAYLGYEGYFLAHAKWFCTTQGRKLLEHLERWAEEGPRVGGGELQ